MTVILHRPADLRMTGSVSYFTSIDRYVCPCGKREFVYWNGRKVETHDRG